MSVCTLERIGGAGTRSEWVAAITDTRPCARRLPITFPYADAQETPASRREPCSNRDCRSASAPSAAPSSSRVPARAPLQRCAECSAQDLDADQSCATCARTRGDRRHHQRPRRHAVQAVELMRLWILLGANLLSAARLSRVVAWAITRRRAPVSDTTAGGLISASSESSAATQLRGRPAHHPARRLWTAMSFTLVRILEVLAVATLSFTCCAETSSPSCTSWTGRRAAVDADRHGIRRRRAVAPDRVRESDRKPGGGFQQPPNFAGRKPGDTPCGLRCSSSPSYGPHAARTPPIEEPSPIASCRLQPRRRRPPRTRTRSFLAEIFDPDYDARASMNRAVEAALMAVRLRAHQRQQKPRRRSRIPRSGEASAQGPDPRRYRSRRHGKRSARSGACRRSHRRRARRRHRGDSLATGGGNVAQGLGRMCSKVLYVDGGNVSREPTHALLKSRRERRLEDDNVGELHSTAFHPFR